VQPFSPKRNLILSLFPPFNPPILSSFHLRNFVLLLSTPAMAAATTSRRRSLYRSRQSGGSRPPPPPSPLSVSFSAQRKQKRRRRPCSAALPGRPAMTSCSICSPADDDDLRRSFPYPPPAKSYEQG
ncbi:hypothetical protein LINGRAPRIM_LOCUS2673, partial [Linum grandiflorum]